ncbi:hypothetical protein [Bifidobacterium sp. ESL0745]|uniref:hypothetical protein n=1 Tax=Bifidobacterium sp. ESL0745 TaxID=2983226 RepID=UPI0023F61A6E|nr:hypothetical protein [Bifidobacterium sp. ESL0745]MDF7665698.1 hypothetical protein [Bifidobacterium sp. ESL0745]
MKVVVNTPFEFLPEDEAMRRTPYRTKKLFREHYGDLFRVEKPGQKGGYLASDLQARTETFPTEERV